ncbi:MAG: hypothetical protein AMXMBFR53_36650 [Gemmatimonadota bacterium]
MDAPRRWNSTLGTSKPLERHAQLQRRTYLKAVNRERKARRREAGDVYGPGYVWATQQPCEERGHPLHRCGWSRDRRPEAHHLKTVGSGGKDANNLIFCCHALHDEFHARTLEDMERKYRKDYHAVARRIWRAWQEHEGGLAA